MSTPSGSLSARAGNIVSSTSGASGVPRKPLSRFGSAAVGPEPIPDGQRRRLVRSVSESAKRTSFTDRQNILLDQRPKMDMRESWFRKTCMPARFNPLHATLIDDNILIGSREAAANMTLLRYYGVTHILNVSAQVPNYFEDSFLYCKIPLVDIETETVRPHLRRAFEFLNDALKTNSRVLIHCIAGASRSVTIAIGYIMYRRQSWLVDVLKDVQSKRHIAQPNNGFLLELADLEVELLGFSSVASSTAKMWNFREFNKQRKRYKVAPQRPKQCIIM